MIEQIIFGVTFVHLVLSIYRLDYGLCSLLAIKILIPDATRSIIPLLSLNSLCSIILLFALFLHVLGGRLKNLPRNNSLIKFGLFFYCFNWFYILICPVPAIYQLVPMHNFFILQLLPAILCSIIIVDKSKFLLITRVFCFSFLICSIYGLYSWITNNYIYTDIFINHYGYGRDADMSIAAGVVHAGIAGRIIGTASGDSYSYGMIAPLGFMITYIMYKYTKNKMMLIALLLLLLNVGLTIRRAPILTIIIFFLCLFFFEPLKNNKKYIQIGFILLLVVIVSVQVMPFLAGFKNILMSSLFFWDENVSAMNDVSGSSVSLRKYQLYYTFNQIKDNILFGNGWGSMYYTRHDSMFGWESILFTTLMQFGLAGIFLWGKMFSVIYKYSLQNQNCKIYQRSFIIASIILCILTDNLYPAYIFFGCVLMGKSYLLKNDNLDVLKNKELIN